MVTKELMQAYFAGQVTPLQRKMIADWLKQQPANRELYFRWLEEWERRVPQYAPDIDQALGRFRQRIDQPQTAVIDPYEYEERQQLVRIGRRTWLWAAAASLVLGVLAYTGQDLVWYKVYATDFGQTRLLKLPDSSVVTLNGHSMLYIPRFGFGESTRRVRLEGEAVFDVRHTVTHQRFLVETPDGVEVEVLGTEFSVMARPHATKVALNRGKVQLSYPTLNAQRQQLMMKPGDWVTLSQQGELTQGRNTHHETFAAWRSHQFVFDNTPLREIVNMVKETYGLTVRLADTTLADRTLSGTYKARTSNDLIRAIAEVLELQVTRSGKTLTLSAIPPRL
ncbi:FecR domain-containing protein [Arsenicibacter rosenii]|uniref:Iron dicitrate transport regulator FecR n=1 Tax=Arsenicibacter rosenii TaxID=1750698 RepID=A0A1S2VE55_9BACT|nr:FecR domain-containing protein [Arsenicibacter rosenii]OIN57003.1 hypothetical protein BLX24_21865 [Arsenicibacter rosenii]